MSSGVPYCLAIAPPRRHCPLPCVDPAEYPDKVSAILRGYVPHVHCVHGRTHLLDDALTIVPERPAVGTMAHSGDL